ncbi:MAG: fructokinase [Candidatus Hydrogenedentes bacterium]|nr:fructokinase [Candidatus Hydrogenedentota bacterium]
MASEDALVVVGLGEVLWDLFPEGKQLGGAPANFAYHAQALGARGLAVSCVGDDELGQAIVEQLTARGLDMRYVAVDSGHPTGTVSVTLDRNGVPAYVIHTDVAWDFLPASPDLLALARRTDAVCFGTLAQRAPVTRETMIAFLDTTPAGCLRLFDINLRQSYYDVPTILRSLDFADALKLNDGELTVLKELLGLAGTERHVIDVLIRDFGLRAVALTRGDQGSLLVTQDGASEHPGCPPERIADTVGAGDCFSAAFVMGLLHSEPLDAINEKANRLAGYVCSQTGAMPIMPLALTGA